MSIKEQKAELQTLRDLGLFFFPQSKLTCLLFEGISAWLEAKENSFMLICLGFFVTLGMFFEGLVKGCDFLQVKLLSCCTSPALLLPSPLHPAVQICFLVQGVELELLVPIGAEAYLKAMHHQRLYLVYR